MDVVAHTLWTGVAVVALHPRARITVPAIAAALSMAALPDVVQLLPIALWWLLGSGTWAALVAYAVAVPGQEPSVPSVVQLASHHLHCVMHSVPIVAFVSLCLWSTMRRVWAPLAAWWLHIVIDLFTHSSEYYAVPVLYPFTDRGFDGVAWNTPWFMALNYLALGASGIWLAVRRARPKCT